MSRLSKLLNLANSATARQTYLVSTGNLLNALFGFFSIIIISRTLGPANFGVFSLATSLLIIGGDVFDLGINSGIIKFAAEQFGLGNIEEAYRYLKASLVFKALAGLFVAFFGYFISPYLATMVFHDSSLTNYLRLSLAGVVGILLFSFSSSFLQSKQEYLKLTAINLISGTGKVVGVMILLLLFHLNSFGALTVYVITPFLAFLISLFFVGHSFMNPRASKTHWLDIFNFSKWTAILVLFSTLHARIDILMLSSLTSKQEVGFYSAASRLTFVFPILASSFGSVVIPKVVNFQSKEELQSFLRKSLVFVAANALLILLLIASSNLIITSIYGPRFLASSVVFQVLLLGMLAFIAASPLTTTFYKFNTPYFFAAISFIELIATVLLNLLLIPNFAGLGAAVSFSLVNVLGFVITFFFIRWKMSHF
jgi:O-antigen/teichoic acid export membrane protein